MTLQALFDLGFEDEASAFMSWLLHATRLTWPQLQNVYDVFGRVDLAERRLDHLEGYARSRPVRTGNKAERQFQLDTYGEVIDAAFHFVRRGGRIDRGTARMLRGFGETVIRRWTEPDDGIWEERGERDQRTYSKVMCWVALDRLIRLQSMGVIDLPVATFDSHRKRIREAIDMDALNPALGAYVSVFGGLEPDASLLLLAHYGYVDANDPRMRRTAEVVRERLGNGPLLYRYRPDSPGDGLPPGEGAFGVCSFWGVETRAMQGELDDARADFETLLGYANDVGLFAEQIDPRTGDALGNFPQAFTHVGLIRAALAMSECEARGSIPHPGAEAALRLVAGDRR